MWSQFEANKGSEDEIPSDPWDNPAATNKEDDYDDFSGANDEGWA